MSTIFFTMFVFLPLPIKAFLLVLGSFAFWIQVDSAVEIRPQEGAHVDKSIRKNKAVHVAHDSYIKDKPVVEVLGVTNFAVVSSNSSVIEIHPNH